MYIYKIYQKNLTLTAWSNTWFGKVITKTFLRKKAKGKKKEPHFIEPFSIFFSKVYWKRIFILIGTLKVNELGENIPFNILHKISSWFVYYIKWNIPAQTADWWAIAI